MRQKTANNSVRSKPIKSSKSSRKRDAGQLRIIGGQWRSRRLPIVDLPGLRPTPDRVRETLFNWLQFEVRGQRCLDLFAGSGALGLEAASRGATEVVLVEKQMKATAQLRHNIATLKTESVRLIHDDALHYLQHANSAFDGILLDPPFRQALLMPVLALIRERKLLDPSGWLYVEHEQELQLDWHYLGYQVSKETKAGDVICVLLRLRII